jgi:hypothetical protein
MKINQADARGKNASKANGVAKRLRARAVRRAWKLYGEVVPEGRYHGWVS